MKMVFERTEIMAIMDWYSQIFMDTHDLMPECSEKNNILRMINDINGTSWKDICDALKDSNPTNHGVSVAWNDFQITMSIKPEMLIDLATVYPTGEIAKVAVAMFYGMIAIDKIGMDKIKVLFNTVKDIIKSVYDLKGSPEVLKSIELFKSVDIDEIMVSYAAVQAKWNVNESDDNESLH